jgi:hypothetical protein
LYRRGGARSAGQIQNGVGDRIRAQVTLHAFAEELNDRPRPGEHANALHLSGGILCYLGGDFDQVGAMLPSNVTMYRPSEFCNSSTLRGTPQKANTVEGLGSNGGPTDLVAGCCQTGE